jgi:hypothetical protein
MNLQTRIKKTDTALMKEALREMGFTNIKVTRKYVCAYRDGEYWARASFDWCHKTSSWVFQMTRHRVNTVTDLDVIKSEYPVELAAQDAADSAYEAWKRSRTKKRWEEYLGAVAALYFRFLG